MQFLQIAYSWLVWGRITAQRPDKFSLYRKKMLRLYCSYIYCGQKNDPKYDTVHWKTSDQDKVSDNTDFWFFLVISYRAKFNRVGTSEIQIFCKIPNNWPNTLIVGP